MKTSSICILLLSFAFLGCSSRQKRELSHIEDLLYQYPDSALILLDKLDPEDNISSEMKARYALLMSIALDKNYIDMTEDSIIRPAVDYYSLHQGKYRMLSWYYCGLVSLNAHSYSAAIIAFEEAEKSFRGRKILHNLSAVCLSGQITAAVGPNGSGKSTLLKLAGHFMLPDSGSVTVREEDAVLKGEALRMSIAYMSPELRLYPRLTARENLSFFLLLIFSF